MFHLIKSYQFCNIFINDQFISATIFLNEKLNILKFSSIQNYLKKFISTKSLNNICIKIVVRIQKEVLPMVHSLCQDVNSEVRANICLQLRFVAEGLSADTLKTSLLPSLVELASDEESNVRCAAVETIAYLLPYFQEGMLNN